MTVIDRVTLFSNDQAITASTASTDTLDLRVDADIGAGQPITLVIQPTADFNNLTSLDVAGPGFSNSFAFGSPETLLETSLPLANLVAGRRFPIGAVPRGMKRYMRLYYTVTGTNPTTGTITGGRAQRPGQRDISRYGDLLDEQAAGAAPAGDRTADRIAAALALIRQTDERWHGLAVLAVTRGMDRDSDLLDRLAARARRERYRAAAIASRRREP